jgi:hypothetical protein
MYVFIVFAILRMKKACLLQIVLIFLLVSVQVPGAQAKLGNRNSGTVDYDVGDSTGWTWEGDLVNEDGSTVSGGIWMYNDVDTIYIAVLVWVKPYLAYGELETFKGSGVLDWSTKNDPPHDPPEYKKDKDNDGTVDRYDLGSDGIIIEGLGDPYYVDDDKQKGYRWFVDTKNDGSHDPKDDEKRRDPEIDVPSWNANLGPGGILEGKIEYFAEIPIADVVAAVGDSPWEIHIEVHASPKNPIPEFVIPEVPFGTIGALVAFFAALGVTAIRKN